ncbi:MAG: deoxyribodipyrimidine photo-lyase [Chloroflexota bacterium]
MSDQPVIHWFRRDLRVTDNTALNAAMETGQPVITVFCFDDRILESGNAGTPRLAFMLNALDNLQTSIWKAGGRLLFLHGNPLRVLPALTAEADASAVYINKDYTPYSVSRDRAMQEALNVPLHCYDDALIMAPGTVMTQNGDPYSVYTPFKNNWRSSVKPADYAVHETPNGHLYRIQEVEAATELPSLDELRGSTDVDLPTATEDHAQQRLEHFTNGVIYAYDMRRNELTLNPFDGGDAGTSQLSPYFRMGVLSPRQAFTAAAKAGKNAPSDEAKASVTTWADELIWREFYMHVMAHFPHVYRGNFRDTYDNLAWDDNPDALERWKNGKTGYPIVDAAMRQLRATGWMPNRARMVVSSFLTKDLLINWREGEKHFMQLLIDGDPAANNGGWQWAAGTGTDAQPYFRIFNPTSQSTKFDKNGDYIRRWVPELADLGKKAIHEPWAIDRSPKNYPEPIVDHKQAREKTLAAFKKARENA